MPAQVSSAATGASGQAKPSAGGKAKGSFLTEFHKLPEGRLKSRPSGLQIATVRQGSGLPLGKGMTVSVRYTGWLEGGTEPARPGRRDCRSGCRRLVRRRRPRC